MLRDAAADEAAVGLDLRFAGAARADRALHAFEVGPLARKARQQVLHLGQRDLQAALLACGRASRRCRG